MDAGSFTIEFPDHLPLTRRKNCLDYLVEKGGRVEQTSTGVFRIHCNDQSQVELVGWALFQTGLAKLCRVTGTTGSAEARADVYARGHSAR